MLFLQLYPVLHQELSEEAAWNVLVNKTGYKSFKPNYPQLFERPKRIRITDMDIIKTEAISHSMFGEMQD